MGTFDLWPNVATRRAWPVAERKMGLSQNGDAFSIVFVAVATTLDAAVVMVAIVTVVVVMALARLPMVAAAIVASPPVTRASTVAAIVPTPRTITRASCRRGGQQEAKTPRS